MNKLQLFIAKEKQKKYTINGIERLVFIGVLSITFIYFGIHLLVMLLK